MARTQGWRIGGGPEQWILVLLRSNLVARVLSYPPYGARAGGNEVGFVELVKQWK